MLLTLKIIPQNDFLQDSFFCSKLIGNQLVNMELYGYQIINHIKLNNNPIGRPEDYDRTQYFIEQIKI